MDLVLLLGLATLGLILGSFLNALLYRFHTGLSIASGRSKCMSCGHTLGAHDLVPVFSHLFLRGKCRYCRSRISLQYPLVEASAALLLVGAYLRTETTIEFVFTALLCLVLLFVFVYDLRHYIIPWSALTVLILLSLSLVLVRGAPVESLVAGPLLALPLFVFSLVSGGRWMGWGDAPLQLTLGWWLGLSLGFSGLLLAFWSGAIVGIALMWLSKAYTMKSEVPFAPFLIFGALCAYFFHVDILQALPSLL